MYKKIEIDNPVCMRRFHLAYDDETETASEVKIHCPHCQVVIFASADHPRVSFLREENLTSVSDLSPLLINECKFQDRF